MLRRSPRDGVRGRGLSRPSVVALLICLWSALLGATGLAPAGAADGQITQFSIPTAGSVPDGITAGPDGNLWFVERLGNKIARITPAGLITEYPIPTPSSGPLAITVGPDGNLWFTEITGNKIGRISTGGVITEFSVPTADSGPHGLTVGPDGNLWFAELFGDNIARMTLSGQITEFPVPTYNSYPAIITLGPDGNLWFTEWLKDKIGRITPSGSVTEFPTPTAGSQPHGITVGPDGNLWFTEFSGHSIGRITPSGVITEFATPTPDSKPAFIAAAPDGNLWFTEYNKDRIGRITTAGSIVEYAIPSGPGANGLSPVGTPRKELGPVQSLLFMCVGMPLPNWPTCEGPACPIGIGVGPDANLWFTEFHGDKIGRITDTPAPAATLVPTSGPPGTTVEVSGSGYGAFEKIHVAFLDSSNGLSILGVTMTDGSGRFSVEVAIPSNASVGAQKVVALGTVSKLRVVQVFLVT